MENNQLPEAGALTRYLEKRSCFTCGRKDVVRRNDDFKYLRRPIILSSLETILNSMISLICKNFSEEAIIKILNELDLSDSGLTDDEMDFVRKESITTYQERLFFSSDGRKRIKNRK